MTQPDLARAIERTQQSVSDLETGKSKEPDALTLVRLSKVLETDAEWLLTGQGEPESVHSITHDESELLLLFRNLSDAGRQFLLSRARALHQEERGTPTPPPHPAKPGSKEGDTPRPTPPTPH